MWNRPWTTKQGFLIGGILVFAGLALQLGVGPVGWGGFAWPANGVAMAALLCLVAVVSLLRGKVYLFRFVGTLQAAIPAMVCALSLTIVMGLTRQTSGGTWLHRMQAFWPFVLVYAYMALILGVVTLRRLSRLCGGRWSRRKVRDVAFVLNHLGLFLAMTTATLGHADMQRLKMTTVVGQPERRALTREGEVRHVPMAIQLRRFVMETYDDGTPRRFASEIQIQTRGGKTLQATVDVNKPVEVDGWRIYQHGYDTQMGAMSQTSVLELVSDPWLPLVYAGIYMMLAGAACMFLMGRAED